uniref:B30.2/SPRY domain-containing protein n=1 Tax=Fundulus heteroclitus TaxID=8078 RepID=A0A3Q2QW59_FUNHE
AAKPREIPCDMWTETKAKALKSCLVCLLSYCETHLEPHQTAPRLNEHQLMDPVKNLEEMLCKEHDKPLELFCKTDQTCGCSLCLVLVHKTHVFVPLSKQYEEMKAELKKLEPELQQKIQNNRLNIQEIKRSLKSSKDAADREKAEGVHVFTALKESVEKALKDLIKDIEDKQKTTEKQRSSEVKQLLQSEDQLNLFQSFYSVKAAPPTKNWTEFKKFYNEAELKRVQQYAVDVTLDPETAHPALILSEDEKHVHCDKAKNKSKSGPKRFTLYHNVLGKQHFFTGRFYFEVPVRGNNHWTLSVARESVIRKGPIQLSPENGYWTIGLRRNKYKSFDESCNEILYFSQPKKVGVFVDFEDGLVSFYDVNKIYPFFSPGPNPDGKISVPLFISPVHQTY